MALYPWTEQRLLVPQKFGLKHIGSQAFAVAVPKLQRKLPVHMRPPPSLDPNKTRHEHPFLKDSDYFLSMLLFFFFFKCVVLFYSFSCKSDSIWILCIFSVVQCVVHTWSHLLTSPWYLKESYTLRMKSQNGQRYSNLNSSTKSASSTSAQTTRNFRYRKVLEIHLKTKTKNPEWQKTVFRHKHTRKFKSLDW